MVLMCMSKSMSVPMSNEGDTEDGKAQDDKKYLNYNNRNHGKTKNIRYNDNISNKNLPQPLGRDVQLMRQDFKEGDVQKGATSNTLQSRWKSLVHKIKALPEVPRCRSAEEWKGVNQRGQYL